jgi:hypothetical protein
VWTRGVDEASAEQDHSVIGRSVGTAEAGASSTAGRRSIVQTAKGGTVGTVEDSKQGYGVGDSQREARTGQVRSDTTGSVVDR